MCVCMYVMIYVSVCVWNTEKEKISVGLDNRGLKKT